MRRKAVDDDDGDSEHHYKVHDAGYEDNECCAKAGLFGGLGRW